MILFYSVFVCSVQASTVVNAFSESGCDREDYGDAVDDWPLCETEKDTAFDMFKDIHPDSDPELLQALDFEAVYEALGAYAGEDGSE